MPTPISDICFPYQHWHIAFYSHAYIYYETFFYCFHQPHFSSSCFIQSRVVYCFFATVCLFELPTNSTWSEFIWHWKVKLCLLVSAQKDFMFRFFLSFFVLWKLTIDTSIYVQNMLLWKEDLYNGVLVYPVQPIEVVNNDKILRI